ncbi:MAG: response regulator, partial [Planctomycetota bacterium]|nr:response regulator [Planctomycetota bacterium]
MSNLIRLLIADDSAVARRMLSEAVGQEIDIELVGAAKNGNEAIALFHSLKPDVVLLDVEMPVADGLIALKAIRSSGSTTPVIMFSALTVRDGEATLDSLSAGASDYVAKPTGVGHIDKVIQYLRTEVNSRVRIWGHRARLPVEK